MNTQPMFETTVLDHGLVALVDVLGTDHTPAYMARTSYRTKGEDKTDADNEKLVRYLINNNHNTPVEFCEAVFYMILPIFVARQLVRHRTASINEESLRYVEARREFYIPMEDRCVKQSTTNKQGSSEELINRPIAARKLIMESCCNSFDTYEQLLQTGLARELCRIVLPLNTYTAWYWKCDMHNIRHLLNLRLNVHAQWEIRQYAQAMMDQLRNVFPTLLEDL